MRFGVETNFLKSAVFYPFLPKSFETVPLVPFDFDPNDPGQESGSLRRFRKVFAPGTHPRLKQSL